MDLYSFYLNYYEFIYFLYGLFFFQMGFAIIMQMFNYRSLSQLKMVKSLWLLALFGISHGLAEWSFIFNPIQIKNFGELAIQRLEFFQTLVIAVSFWFLFNFGLKLLIDSKRISQRWFYLPTGLFLLWLFGFSYMGGVIPYAGFNLSVMEGETWIRYFLAFPGALVSSWALNLEYNKLRTFKKPSLVNNFKYASIIFLIYAVVGGLVVPETSFYPASILNTGSFIKIFAVPVQLVRALCGILMAIFIIRGLAIFEYENRRWLEQIQLEKMLLEERTRISRDLHDGIIQAIYTVGLNIDNSLYLREKSPAEAQKLLRGSVQQIDDIVTNLRKYILGLRPGNLQGRSLLSGLKKLVDDFQRTCSIETKITVQGESNTFFSEQQCSHIYHIVQEVLSNIRKHSNATVVRVMVEYHSQDLEISITDNGKGFNPEVVSISRGEQGSKQGLANILERTELILGQVEFNSSHDKGAKITLKIPYGGQQYDQDSHCG